MSLTVNSDVPAPVEETAMLLLRRWSILVMVGGAEMDYRRTKMLDI